jgi:hypothetical protein
MRDKPPTYQERLERSGHPGGHGTPPSKEEPEGEEGEA